MAIDERHIVGSAEPLSPEQTEQRLRELAAWGVDLSLVWASLQESPEQRLDHLLGVLAFTQELQRANQKRLGALREGTRSAIEEASRP